MDFGVVEGGNWVVLRSSFGCVLGVKLGAFVLQPVSKKTTHRSLKKIGFTLWFFLPPFTEKFVFFGVFSPIWIGAIIRSPRGRKTNKSNAIKVNSSLKNCI